MNNYEKIKSMDIDGFALTISSYAAVCVFKVLEELNLLKFVDKIEQERYTKELFNIAKNMLLEESEE